MADVYKHVTENKVVLTMRGREAIQHVSNSELIRLGRQVVEKVQTARQAEETAKQAQETAKQAAETAMEAEESTKQPEDNAQQTEEGVQQADEKTGQSDETTGNQGQADAVIDDVGDGPHYNDGLSDEDLEIRFRVLNVIY